LTLNFDSLGLAEPIRQALAADGYTVPTPIQARAIPLLLEGRDVLGIAETGSGKTAAFALPILQRLAERQTRAEPKRPRALVLAPTRELAAQIADGFATYGRNLKLTRAVVFGGVGQGPQVSALARGVDILIATPGRLLDLMEQKHVRFDRVETLVLDEADRMLDMGFIRDIRRIVAEVPKTRQSVLISATMPGEIAKLAAEILKHPERVEVARAGKTVDRIDQRLYRVETAAKRGLLVTLLGEPAMSRVIVFTRTKHGANKLEKQLGQAGIVAEAIHGNKSQNARQRALDGFKAGSVRVLVATDVAARGLDIDEVTHVVNFDVPMEPESYVHRIGRTARAGAAGTAITFCAADEKGKLRDIERLIRQEIPVLPTPELSAAALRAPAATSQRDGELRAERGGRPQRNQRQGDRSGRPQRDQRAPRARSSSGERSPERGEHRIDPRGPAALAAAASANRAPQGKPGNRPAERDGAGKAGPRDGASRRPRRRQSRPQYAYSGM
jgi:ATP-dependent RNA helicase RhlE